MVFGSIPSGTQMLFRGIDKHHSPGSVSFDVTKSYVGFHHTPRVIIELFVLFSKDKLLLYLIFCLTGSLY